MSSKRSRWRSLAAVLIVPVALALEACGGGGGAPAAPLPVNRAPVLEQLAGQSVDEDARSITTISASDADGDVLSLEALAVPGFAAIEQTGEGLWNLTISPGFDDAGDYTITLRVMDSRGATDEQSFQLHIVNVNRAPALTRVTNTEIAEGGLRQVLLSAMDPDGDSVEFSVAGAPAFAATVDNGDGTGALNFAPGFFDSGVYALTVRATDGAALFDETQFTITVNEVNRAPIVTVSQNVSLAEGDSLIVPLSAIDPDGDAVSFSSGHRVAFSTLTDNGDGTGTVHLQPGFFDSGDYAISVQATDGRSATQAASIAISVTNVNRDPLLTSVADQALSEGETLSVSLSATDADEDAIALSAVDLPEFVSLVDNGNGTGRLELTPEFTDSGIYPVILRVTDVLSGVDEIDFFVTVGDVNRSPILDAPGTLTVAEGERLALLLSGTDADDDSIAFETDTLPAFVTLSDQGNGNAELLIEPEFLDIGAYTMTVRITDSGFPSLSDEGTFQLIVNTLGSNQVARENAMPGTADWHLDNPALQREIEGYASATSINRGDVISLYVHTFASTYSLEIFRTGWYGGDGARRVLGPVEVPGTAQITPAPDPETGLVEANWGNPYDVQTSESLAGNPWATGIYLARLTESVTNRQSYVIFVVREDDQYHDVTFQLPVTTYQAYNAWGGKSLYGFNSGAAEPWGSTAGIRASHVSFDRPYARNDSDVAAYGMGAGEYLTNVQPVGRIDGAGWDYNMVRWLEYQQYDVNYVTNIDTHRDGFDLIETELFVSQGHDEYWSWEMRGNVERTRNNGVDLAFFSSNAAYVQVRFEPGASDVADRIMVAYKDETTDPVFNDANPLNDYLTTIPFRYLPVPRPEESLIGVQYVLDPYDGDIVVTNPSHWVFYGTGFAAGSRLNGLLGYEPDGMFGGGPSNIEVLAETPIVSAVDPENTGTSHMTIYEANAWSSVFATGSLQWSWGLDDYNAPQLRTSRLSAAAQQISGNVLEVFGARPYVGDFVEASCVRIVSYADAGNDRTMAAAEFDLLDQHGYAISNSNWSLEHVSSQEQVSTDASALYAFDGDMATFWQTQWVGLDHPHEIQFRLPSVYDIGALLYTPRQDLSLEGTVADYEIFTSLDCHNWQLVAAGTWEGNGGRKIARFTR